VQVNRKTAPSPAPVKAVSVVSKPRPEMGSGGKSSFGPVAVRRPTPDFSINQGAFLQTICYLSVSLTLHGHPELEAKTKKLTEELAQLKLVVESLETERDFYFGKLRDVEILCQTFNPEEEAGLLASQFVKKVTNILYAEESAAGETEEPVFDDLVLGSSSQFEETF
jgi:RP/EB family microtubule-associated protein